MRERILSLLRARGAEERLARAAGCERELRALERELAEVKQLIPPWSRIFFFIESADERREKELRARIASVRQELESARRAVRSDLESVGEELPPFAIACLVEDALGMGEAGSIGSALERTAKALLATWAPGFDAEPVLEKLASASACQVAAGRGASLARDERLLHAAASGDALLPVLARQVLASGYFEEQERAFELTSKRNRLVDEHEQAAADVPLLHKLNPFSTSAAEKRRNDLADEIQTARDELRLSHARARRLLDECVLAYPPLALHHTVLETLAVSALTEPDEELALGAGGSVLRVPVDRARVLLVASLARLERAFRDVFPGVPLPKELAAELLASRASSAPRSPVGKAGALPPPLEPLVLSFVGELARSRAPELLGRALEDARAAGAARRARERAASRISWTHTLAFWSESEEKEERDRHLERERWHEYRGKRARADLVATARDMGAVLAPFRLRDVTLEALRDVERVSTNPGQHAAHLLPAVFGVDAVLRSIKAARRILEQSWGLSGDEGDMLDAIAAAEPRDVTVDSHERLVWEPLERRELASLLAFRLDRSGFQDTLRRVRAAEERERAAQAEKDEVSARLSIWDRINVFSSSPDKQRNRDLGRTLARLGAELEAAVERLRAHLGHALHVYPPAQLYFSLPAVERAVRAIHAECKPIWVNVKYRERLPGIMEEEESDGDFTHEKIEAGSGPLVVQVGRPPRDERWVERERQELRYICILVGKEEAQLALASWAARVVGSFGDLPGYQELLETWARSASAAAPSAPTTTSSPLPSSSTPSGPKE
jgi:hypothetical protein